MPKDEEIDPLESAQEAEDLARVEARTALYKAIRTAAEKGDHAIAQGFAAALNVFEGARVED